MFVWAVPPKWAFNYSDAVCSGTNNVSLCAWNHSWWCHSQHFHLILCSLDWGAKAPFSSVAKIIIIIMNILSDNWICNFHSIIEFITFIYRLCLSSSTLCTKYKFSYVSPHPFFFLDAPLVTWSGWMELKSPAFTPSVPHGRATGERVWPSHHPNSLATAPKVTEAATVKQRWPSTGRTWAWASALSLPSLSASRLC